jgi:chitinase
MQALLIISFFLLTLHSLTLHSLFADQPWRVGGWLQSWQVNQKGQEGRKPFTIDLIEPNLVDDLFFAFVLFGVEPPKDANESAKLTNDYLLRFYNQNDSKQLEELIALQKKGVGKPALWVTVGGEHFNNPNDPWNVGQKSHKLFSLMVKTKENRREFIASCIKFAHQFGLNGIEIDWEYPGDQTKGGADEDFDKLYLFIKECKEAFEKSKPPLKISLALAPIPPSGIEQKYHQNPDLYYQWLAKLIQAADRATLMCYSYHTPFDQSGITGVNAPLNRDTSPNSTLYIAKTLQRCRDAGVPLEKTFLGIPVFGWRYDNVQNLNQQIGVFSSKSGAALPYFSIADLVAKKKFTFHIDNQTNTAYGVNLLDRQWMSFDVPQTTALKVKLAKEMKLAGVVFWSIEQDEYDWEPRFPNIKTAKIE